MRRVVRPPGASEQLGCLAAGDVAVDEPSLGRLMSRQEAEPAVTREDICAELSWENEGGRIRSSVTEAELLSLPGSEDPLQRLAAEHELFLRSVIERAAGVLAALVENRWPEHELAEFVDHAQSTHAVTALSADRVASRCALGIVTDVSRGPSDQEASSLVEAVVGLVIELVDCLDRERQIRARHATRVGWQRMPASIADRSNSWYRLTPPQVVNLDDGAQRRHLIARMPR